MSTEIIYTLSERTVKKYTVKDAVDAALVRLKGQSVCTDKIKGKEDTDQLTLQELNQLADDLVDDTLYWEGHFHGVPSRRI